MDNASTWRKDRAALRELTCAAHDVLIARIPTADRDIVHVARLHFLSAFDAETAAGENLARVLDAKLATPTGDTPAGDAAPATSTGDTAPAVLLAWLKRHELSSLPALTIYSQVWEGGRPFSGATFRIPSALVWSVDEASVTLDIGALDISQTHGGGATIVGQIDLDLTNLDDSLDAFVSLLGRSLSAEIATIARWYTPTPNTTFSRQPHSI